MVFFEKLKKHVLSIFVGNVSHHYSRPSVEFHIFHVNYVGFGLLGADGSAVAN